MPRRLAPLALVLLALSAPPAAAQFAEVYGWGEGHPLRAEFVDHNTLVPETAARAGTAARGRPATFLIEYVGFSPEARAAFQAAADLWSGYVSSDVPIRIRATFAPEEGNVLGSASPRLISNFAGALSPDTFFPVALASALAGRDFDTENPHIEATFNAAFPRWYFGTDGAPPQGDFDFVTVALHEIGHGLGIVGTMRVDRVGQSEVGRWGLTTQANRTFPAIFDQFTETDLDGATTPLLDTRRFPNPSAVLAVALQSEAVYFSASTANRAQVQSQAAAGLPVGPGGRPKLHAPDNWSPGSSYAHLTEMREVDPATGAVRERFYPPGSPNSLMTPTLGSREVIRSPGPVVCGMLRDMGWPMGVNCNAILPEAPPALEVPLLVGGPCVNPVRSGGRTGLVVHLREAQRVRVEVYDLLGRRVLRAFDGLRQPSEPTLVAGRPLCLPASPAYVEVNVGSLAAGVYVLRVVTPDAAEAVRFTVVR